MNFDPLYVNLREPLGHLERMLDVGRDEVELVPGPLYRLGDAGVGGGEES